jgi:hypothetical protein
MIEENERGATLVAYVTKVTEEIGRPSLERFYTQP